MVKTAWRQPSLIAESASKTNEGTRTKYSRPPPMSSPSLQQSDNSDPTAKLLAQKEAVLLSTKNYLRAKLTRWIIRTTIGAILCTFLATQFTWGKWVLIVWLPLAILSLTTLLLGNRKMQRMAAKIEDTVAAIQSNHTPER